MKNIEINKPYFDRLREKYGSVDIPLHYFFIVITGVMPRTQAMVLLWILSISVGRNRLNVPYRIDDWVEVFDIQREHIFKYMNVLEKDNVIERYTNKRDKLYNGIFKINTNYKDWDIEYDEYLVDSYVKLMEQQHK